MPRDYLRVGELAVLLKVSPKTAARWIKEGKVAHTRTLGGGVGRGHARVSPEEAARLVALMHEHGSGGLEHQAASS